jgi:hypothetical protein
VTPGQLSATLLDPRPLLFAAADPARDLPGHVRAGSALRRWNERLVVVQDDVNALALLDEVSGVITPLTLPADAEGRRTFSASAADKAIKMDLEACVVLPDGRLVALGSGSTARREHAVVVDGEHMVRVVEGSAFYAGLHARRDFAGSELNLEGALVAGDALLLFQRGNGAPRAGLQPVNAIGELALAAFVAWLDGGPAPTLVSVRQLDLGAAPGGVRFGFTDATLVPDGRVAFLAGAEDSPDSVLDGAVVGCRFGILDGEQIQLTEIVDAQGVPTRLKLEGLDWRTRRDDGSWELAVVADMDQPATPALLATLHVTGG